MSGELKIDLETMSWSAAETVQRVAHPNIPAAGDPVSLMLSSYLPGLVDSVNDKVAEATAKDQAMADKVSAAKAAYQNADDAGGQSIKKADGTIGQSSAVGRGAPGGGADGGMGQFGQMIGMAIQGFQAPAQAAQALGSAPQTAMQAAQQIGQQVQQMAGQAGRDGGKPGEVGASGQQLKAEDPKSGEEKAREEKRDDKPEENKDGEADKKHAVAGPASGSSAPVPQSSPPPRSGRHAANPAVDM